MYTNNYDPDELVDYLAYYQSSEVNAASSLLTCCQSPDQILMDQEEGGGLDRLSCLSDILDLFVDGKRLMPAATAKRRLATLATVLAINYSGCDQNHCFSQKAISTVKSWDGAARREAQIVLRWLLDRQLLVRCSGDPIDRFLRVCYVLALGIGRLPELDQSYLGRLFGVKRATISALQNKLFTVGGSRIQCRNQSGIATRTACATAQVGNSNARKNRSSSSKS